MPGMRICLGTPHTCNFVLNKVDSGQRTCHCADVDCPAPKNFTAIRKNGVQLVNWRAVCGWCKRMWYVSST